MSLSDDIRNHLVSMGFARKREGVRVVPIALLIISALLIVNIHYYIGNNMKAQDDADTRELNIVLAIKDIDTIITETALILEYLLARKHIDALIALLESRFSCYNDCLTESHKKLIRWSKNRQDDAVHYMGLVTWFVYFVLNVVPGVIAADIVFNNGLANTDFTHLPLPMTLNRSERFNNVTAYILIYIFTSTYLFYPFWHGNVALVLLSAAPQKVASDMKFFCMELNRIDQVLNGSNDTLKLTDYSVYLVRRHQGIQNCVREVTQCVSGFMCAFNQTMCFHLCVFLYCATNINNKVVQVLASVCTLSSLTTLLLYCHIGQQLINEGEEIRRSLYFCEWLDKPMWFKKYLLLMTTMANVPLQIRPLGLFVVDYQTFMKITNAAYSYFNLIRTLHK